MNNQNIFKYTKMKIAHDVRQALKAIAEKLPDTVRPSKQYYYKEVQDLRHREVKNDVGILQGQSFQILSEDTTKLLHKRDMHVKVNHYKKLKQAFIKGTKAKDTNGIDEVRNYIQWVNKNNEKINGQYSMQSIGVMLNELLKIKINPIF